MAAHCRSDLADRLELVRLLETGHFTKAQAARQLGYSLEWVRKWWRRYRRGGESALADYPPAAPGPFSRFPAAVATAFLAYRRTYPLVGARRALLALQSDPSLADQRLPDVRTIHRAWAKAGLVARRLARDAPPSPPAPPAGEPHAIWQIDHQDHLLVEGVGVPLVLQSIRAPAVGLAIGADVFLGPRGAHAVAEDDLIDALRRHFARWGRPQALSVDGGVRFLGQPQRQFPSRLELFCAGLGVALVPTRPGHPTDHAAIERQHWTLDAILLGPSYSHLQAVQAALDRHLDDLNESFPSRAKPCGGLPALVAYPQARHSGRPYNPTREWADFSLAGVDRLLAGWCWHRLVNRKTGQISFAGHNRLLGKQWAGKPVTLRFDPSDRSVVVYEPGTCPGAVGPEIKRFPCSAFAKQTILGTSRIAATRPPTPGVRPDDTTPTTPGGTTL